MYFLFILINLSFIAVSLAANAQNNTHSDTLVSSTTDSSENKVFEKVDVEAAFPGGDIAWRKFLERNLRGAVASENGAPSGIYTVWVQFIVDREGKITEVKSLTDNGYGMEREVERIIKIGPQWQPASQNGRVVKAYRKQPVTFIIEDADLEVTPKNSNVLYIGLDNPVTVSCPKTKDKNLRVTISQGSISGDEGNYIVRVTSIGRATIEVYNKNKKIGSFSLEVRVIPNPNSDEFKKVAHSFGLKINN
ncbi:MAG: energy transducer TonB [Chitinophagales bacterium]